MSSANRVTQLTRSDLDTLMNWAEDEGWNPGLDDANAFWATDPSGFWGIKQEGGLIAGISAVKYEGDYGFIGFYICHPDQRGKGLALQVWRGALTTVEGRRIGLDSVPEQVNTYRKSGFEPAHRNLRYTGLSVVSVPQDPRLSPIGTGIFTSIAEYDQAFVPTPRPVFLKAWHQPMNRQRFGFCTVEDGSITGCGTIRACREGYKIGPLFAETAETADLLFRALAGSVRGQMVTLDLPEPNTEAEALAERYELSPVFETKRMYRGDAPDLPLSKIFGITTFELG